MPSQWGRIIGSRRFYASVFIAFFAFNFYPKDTQARLTGYPQNPVDNCVFYSLNKLTVILL
ncbi:hypothetical protein CIK86_01785 [Pseudoalteromonas sp. JB197]|nr:hypothetical protein CIK86_01785 [Pseudoalteromonas sp. JB197]